MAGIGFVLRRLSRQDNLMGITQAYAHSTLASTGPWLFTILALGAVIGLSSQFVTIETMTNFRIIVIYNFAFSLVFSGPIYMVCTRYLADCTYKKDVTSAPGMMIGALIVLYGVQLPIVVVFYFFIANLSFDLALASIINFFLITTIWLIAVFITALKDYKSVTRAFFWGFIISALATALLAEFRSATAIMCGFSAGLVFILSVLIAKVLAEYPYPFKEPFAFLSYFKHYWELALGGLVYNIGIWVDKWIMWFAPEAEQLNIGLISYPNYDSAMFLAYLTIVPSLALFVFSIETNFYEHYLKFYRDIQQGATFKKIRENHNEIIKAVLNSGRNFIILQSTICALVIMASPRIFDALNINYLQMGMFRYGVLGALFHAISLFLMILLSYFDKRKTALLIQVVFLGTNIVFTWLSVGMGFEFYGWGYFLSALFTFIVSSLVMLKILINLPYHTFIVSNTSVSH